MLWIAKVTTGVAVDGATEFSMFVADQDGTMYEVRIDEEACEQLIDIIADSLGGDQHDAPSASAGKSDIDAESRERLANILSPPPQHSVEQSPPKSNGVTMSSVGFDFDYSAGNDDYDDEEEEDPGEEGLTDEDKYVGQL